MEEAIGFVAAAQVGGPPPGLTEDPRGQVTARPTWQETASSRSAGNWSNRQLVQRHIHRAGNVPGRKLRRHADVHQQRPAVLVAGSGFAANDLTSHCG